MARAPETPRKRYFVVSPDSRFNPSDCDFVNKDEALINGRTAGRHEHESRYRNYPFCTGLPQLREKPRLVIGEYEGELLDTYGFNIRFVSDRAKRLLETLDPEGFEFVECDAVHVDGRPLETYWYMNAVRAVEEFDEARSSFIRYADRNPGTPDSLNPAIVALNDIVWLPDLPGDSHSFYLTRCGLHFIVDEAIADAWRDAGFKGALFTPLQPPLLRDLGLDEEYETYLSFVNYPYWNEAAQAMRAERERLP
jgi:hypothetical protein